MLKTTSVSQSGVSSVTVRIDENNYDSSEVAADIEDAVSQVNDLPRDIFTKSTHYANQEISHL